MAQSSNTNLKCLIASLMHLRPSLICIEDARTNERRSKNRGPTKAGQMTWQTTARHRRKHYFKFQAPQNTCSESTSNANMTTSIPAPHFFFHIFGNLFQLFTTTNASLILLIDSLIIIIITIIKLQMLSY